tara:strand:+ start:27 stop:254 length:228 start_codon:yes stop_codon:yes gene_type:complete
VTKRRLNSSYVVEYPVSSDGCWISPTYILLPMTAEKLLERGYCCGLKCKNCPYLPRYKKGNKKREIFSSRRENPV